jgi:hypothetical protein
MFEGAGLASWSMSFPGATIVESVPAHTSRPIAQEGSGPRAPAPAAPQLLYR